MTNPRHSVCVGAVVGLLAAGAVSAYGQWPQFRGPNAVGADNKVFLASAEGKITVLQAGVRVLFRVK